MECVNLKRRFGRQYRVTYEESYVAQYGEGGRTEDPWLMILRCLHGHIFPHGGETLAASTNRHGKIAKQLLSLSSTTIHQHGDDGVTVLFHVDDFDAVAEHLKPRRRRQVSEQERVRLAELGRKNLKMRRQANSEARKPELETPSTV